MKKGEFIFAKNLGVVLGAALGVFIVWSFKVTEVVKYCYGNSLTGNMEGALWPAVISLFAAITFIALTTLAPDTKGKVALYFLNGIYMGAYLLVGLHILRTVSSMGWAGVQLFLIILVVVAFMAFMFKDKSKLS